jgi:hypothetical protein
MKFKVNRINAGSILTSYTNISLSSRYVPYIFLIDSNISEDPQTNLGSRDELFFTLGRILLRRT